MKCSEKNRGFTLIELLVVVAIIGVLASVVLAMLNSERDKGKVAKAVSDARQVLLALEFYYDDMGFYPPDTGRGWDPGFSLPLPNNSDTGQINHTAVLCQNCPSNWSAQALALWKGPYLKPFPNTTPWGGKYDYNYWHLYLNRNGCIVPPGIYFGIQADYSNNNSIPQAAEQALLDQGRDGDQCLNGEVQILFYKL